MHVDFSCLFDKGLELETPEMVPFRCTQNIVDGLGAGGYEGVFMRASEITLGVLRNHREALMSVLETFVHDPLVEWSKAVKAGGGSGRRPGGDGQGANFGAEAERGGRRTRLKALDAVHHRARRTAEDEYISRAEEQPLERERLLPASLPNELRALAWVVGRK